MKIQCTKKLLDELKLKPQLGDDVSDEDRFCWHANLFIVNRRKTVVLVNDVASYEQSV